MVDMFSQDPAKSPGEPFEDDEVFVFPVSFAQQRLWFLDQFEPGSPFYNIPMAVRLTGRLDAAALEHALNEIVRRHEALRTTFATLDGQPVQVIAPRLAISLPLVDLQPWPENEREDEARRQALEEASRPFDLTRGPLLRAHLLRLGEEDHLVLLTMHHIISDGWSMSVFFQELAVLYEAYSNGRPSPLPDLPLQYADFAEWQRGWLTDEVLARQMAYWKERLGDLPPVLELPGDRPRPPVLTNAGATLAWRVSKGVTEALKALGRQEGATLFMTLLAAFQTLLYRYSGQEDISVGSPIANRNRAEIEAMIGLFINTLVFRCDLSGEPTFRELLGRLREVTLGAYAHQDLPFEMLVEALQPQRDMSHTPLFQVMLILQNASAKVAGVSGSGLQMEQWDVDSGTATFDITFSIAEDADGLDVTAEYNTDLFDRLTIQRMLQHYQTLLESAVATPDEPISRLSLLTAAEKRQLLVEWNDTQSETRDALCFHQLFEAQVRRDPQALAVVVPAQEGKPAGQMRYGELNARANRLAHYLRKRGVGPEVVVGVCVERSLEMIVAVLGVVKAGGAYLPLDPSYPRDRLRFMIADSRTGVLLTQQSLIESLDLKQPGIRHIVCLDDDWPAIAEENDADPGVPVSPDHLVYMIYTSGSTGQSKGVQIEHRSLVNAARAWEEAYHLHSLRAHLQMANFSFDVFTGDLARALCSGGKLVLCPREFLLAPQQLYALMRQEGVDAAEFVPAVLRLLVHYLEDSGERLDFMKLLVCGSDSWYVEEYRQFQRLCGPGTRLVNSFGLTEATIDSTYFEARALRLGADQIVPIGRPFANTRLYILDRHMQPVPAGVAGELYVGGAGVARGYFNRPELNQEKFIPDPFNPGSRLYRTGDLARYLPDGNVEFLGRLDYQVKIRGFRVETGEIESVLRQHPSVLDAVALAVQPPNREDGAREAEQRLAAYLVADLSVDRVPFHSRCRVTPAANGTGPAGAGQAYECSTADLSYAGVRLVGAPGSWQAGQSLALRLELPGSSEPLDVTGKIAWREGAAAGVRLEADAAQQAALRGAVKTISESPGFSVTDLRRGEPRLPVNRSCQVAGEDGSVQEFILENLSRGGVRLVFAPEAEKAPAAALRAGQAVRVGVQLPGSVGDLWAPGVVWWQRDGRVGVKFELTPDERERLDQGVEAILSEQRFSLGQLRAYLKSRLPDYMVPSAFVLLDALPLTPNGKVDRQALPTPDWSCPELEGEYVAPRTADEEVLAGIWSRVLGVERVGVFDNFFELGGHSLLATQLISRVRDAFRMELPLRYVFESPTVAGFAEQVEVARMAGEGLAAPPVRPVPRDGDLPLSFAQQRLWFLDQLEPDSPAYNLTEALRLDGPLDAPVLEKCLNEIVRRHESLRTTFQTVDGRPVQVIAPYLHIPLPVADLRRLPPAEREAEARRLTQVESQQPFDLAAGPLLRAQLIRLEDEANIVLLTMHHIIGDDWSSSVLIQEITALFDAFGKGRPSPLPPLPIQYADFAHWQRSWLQGEVLEKQLSYWKEQLKDLPPLLELPTDRPRPAVQTASGDYRSFSLPPGLTRAIKELCRNEGVTLFMALLAGFQALLYRYTGQEDIPVGTPIANRNRGEVEGLIGFFVNTLVLRGDLSGEPSFRDLLKRVRETALGAYAYQDLPFEMIVDAVHPQRDLSHSPLFQVMFVLQNTPMQVQEVPGAQLKISPVEAHSGTAKFDLTLFVVEDGDLLSGALEYNTDLFDGSTIERMLGHLRVLLGGAAADPAQSIARLPLLTEAERHRLLVEWNQTEAPFPQEKCAHHLFEEQAARTPQAIAASYKQEQLTYAGLNQRANQLANYLLKLGVGPETLVGLCMERSIEMLVGLLGVMKAGGAYVPIDPGYPPERQAFMLADARAPVLLTQERLLGQLPETKADVICLDAGWERIALESDENPRSGVLPENLAYVIYTSGSTGKPKGAMIEHRGLVNYLTWCQRAYPLRAGQGSPVHSSISFDLTVTSLYTPLLAGGRVLLLPEEQGVEALGEAVRAEKDFSLVKITPAHLQLLGEQIEPGQAAGKTHAFIIGGENLTADHIEFWQRHAPETALVNEYGPTETVVGCCVYWTPPGKHAAGVVPIGRPIINTRLYILDKHRQPVPVGVPGELYIGGAGVGRGYLNRPELSEEKFIPDPFTPGSRLYRTGDLARYLPDGNIECLGRLDFQVKIRGFRVELGEIESMLGKHPAVSEVVVWVREDGGVRRLVAFVVPVETGPGRDGGSTDAGLEAAPFAERHAGLAGELREFLRRELPEYMLPSFFVLLEALPLTANGKVDRQALPAWEGIPAGQEQVFVAPRDWKEEKLAEIWSQVLGLPSASIGVTDSFFELGGDSILSIQVISRARQAGLQLTPRQLFENPTIAGLAAAAGSARPVLAEQGVVTGEAPLTPIQRWFFEQGQPEPQHWNQSVFLSVGAPLERHILEATLARLLEHHDALRQRFRRTPAGWEAEHAPPGGPVPLEWIDLSGYAGPERAQEIERQAARVQASLDLIEGPLVRMAYFDLGPGEPGRLLVVVHHLAIDGVSWRILLEDLQLVYQQLSQGQAPVLPPKTSAYRDWARALQDYAQSEAVRGELETWLSVTAGSPARLPLDFPVGEKREAGADSVSVGLSAEETRALLKDVPPVYRTEINDVLLTALALALGRWSGSPAVLVDLEGHGREDILESIDTSRTVGWFTALYPVRLDLGSVREIGQALQAVKEQLRRVPRHGVGYGLLRYLNEDPQVRQQLERQPAAEVVFNYLGQMDQGLDPALPFGPAPESSGAERSPQGTRPHLLDINAAVAGGRLQVEWSYSPQIHRRETIEKVAGSFVKALQDIITHCQSPEAGGVTLSDFADFGWSQEDLDDILAAIGDMESERSNS